MPEESLSTQLASHLSANIRHVRNERSLTQQGLAKLSGIPRSTISLLEAGDGNPTLHVLVQLSTALRLSIEEILSAPKSVTKLYKKGALPIEKRGREEIVRIQKLLPDPIPGMEIDRIELEPSGKMVGVPHRSGTREYLTCEKGKITLWTLGEKHILSPGDVIAFQGDQRHSYQNTGHSLAVGFSVVTLSPL